VARFHAWLLAAVLRRPLAVLLAWAALAALAVAALLTLKVDGRVEAFLPERDRHLVDYADALRRFGLAETVFVDADRKDVERVRAALRDPGLFLEILGDPDEATRMRTARALAPLVPLLLPESSYGDVEKRLEPEALRARMEEHYERLVGPAGGVYQEILRQDPLELGSLAMGSLVPTPGGRFEGGALLSSDGRRGLITAIPRAPVGDEAGAMALEALFEGLEVSWVGGHRFYLANSRAIQADVGLVSTAGFLLVLLVVVVGFRGARIVGLAALAMALASLGGLAAAVLLFGPVSGVGLAFGGAIGGICADYVLHLHAVPRNGETRREAVTRVYLEIGPTIAVGAATSAAAFLTLLFSEVPVHRQIGVIAAAGILVAQAFSLTAGPVLAIGRGGNDKATEEPRPTPLDRAAGSWFRRILPRAGLALGAALLLLAGAAALTPSLRFERDLRRFESKDAATVEAEETFNDNWGGMLSRAIALVPGNDLEEALRKAEDAQQALGPNVTGPAGILPSKRMQDRRWESWRTFWTGERTARLRTDLAAAGKEFGIKAATFDPFFASLTTRPDPVTPKALEGTAFESVLGRHLHAKDGKTEVLLLVPATAAAPGVRVLTGKGLADAVAEATRGELLLLSLPAILLVAVLLWLHYRSARRVLVALYPMVGGLVLMAGVLVAAGEPLSLLSIPAVVSVFGMGVDYAVFLIDALAGADGEKRVAERSAPVLGAMLASLSTGIALLLASHPGFRALGIAMTAGIGGSFLLAWLGVPKLTGWKR
jgi:predicted exporter